jgi:hypothetical protein
MAEQSLVNSMNVPRNLLSLSDYQLKMIMSAAAYMSPHMRDRFLRALGSYLGNSGEVGDGDVTGQSASCSLASEISLGSEPSGLVLGLALRRLLALGVSLRRLLGDGVAAAGSGAAPRRHWLAAADFAAAP